MHSAIKDIEYYVEDWVGNICLFGRCFDTFELADEYLTKMIERNCPDTLENETRFSEERGEDFIKSAKRSTEIFTEKPRKKATAHLRSRENFGEK